MLDHAYGFNNIIQLPLNEALTNADSYGESQQSAFHSHLSALCSAEGGELFLEMKDPIY